jgi:hypothetical protein
MGRKIGSGVVQPVEEKMSSMARERHVGWDVRSVRVFWILTWSGPTRGRPAAFQSTCCVILELKINRHLRTEMAKENSLRRQWAYLDLRILFRIAWGMSYRVAHLAGIVCRRFVFTSAMRAADF